MTNETLEQARFASMCPQVAGVEEAPAFTLYQNSEAVECRMIDQVGSDGERIETHRYSILQGNGVRDGQRTRAEWGSVREDSCGRCADQDLCPFRESMNQAVMILVRVRDHHPGQGVIRRSETRNPREGQGTRIGRSEGQTEIENKVCPFGLDLHTCASDLMRTPMDDEFHWQAVLGGRMSPRRAPAIRRRFDQRPSRIGGAPDINRYAHVAERKRTTEPSHPIMPEENDWFLSGIDDNPELDLDAALFGAFDNFPSDFRRYWGLGASHAPQGIDPTEWERHQELDRLAKRMAELAASLVRPRKLREEDLTAPGELRSAAAHVRQIFNEMLIEIEATQPPNAEELSGLLRGLRTSEEAEYEFFLACLQLYLSPYLVWPRELAERVVDLTRYAKRVKGDRARQYLSRVSRCYIYGMTAELAVMSRAVLEALLEDAIPEEQVKSIRRIPSNRRVGLSDYIAVAAGTLLPADAVSSARRVKQCGDDAAHVSADLVGDPKDVLEDLVVVLAAIGER